MRQPAQRPDKGPAEAATENQRTATGLTSEEAQRRLAQYGENAIREERVSPLRKLLSFFWGPIPWMIEVAAILSAAAQRWEDFAIIASLLLINAGVGFWEEHKADNAIKALKQRLAPVARASRARARTAAGASSASCRCSTRRARTRPKRSRRPGAWVSTSAW